jgi:hypothetical protein
MTNARATTKNSSDLVRWHDSVTLVPVGRKPGWPVISTEYSLVGFRNSHK